MADEPQTESTGSIPGSLREALQMFPHLREEYNRTFAKRLAEKTAESREALEQAERDLAETRQETEEQTRKHVADMENVSGEFRQYRVDHEIAAALRKAGVIERLHPVAMAVLKKHKIEIATGDDGNQEIITINDRPLDEALADQHFIPDELRNAPAGGGTGARGSDPAQTKGGFEWARAVVNSGEYRQLEPAVKRTVNEALHSGRRGKE
ncbi:MAG: hypothetical protein P9L99_19850 [Candidatus Lernaella stagnicola]|nr:hypothetical protein [Candidatus Lernaella stagnicola]